MICISKGLENSLIVLEYLKKTKEIKDIDIDVGTFTNCRECGLTFKIMKNGGESFTWCVYEHRNSDNIIINGKKGYINRSGDLPYKSDSKYEYLAEFKYNEHRLCALKLAEMFKEFIDKPNKEVKND